MVDRYNTITADEKEQANEQLIKLMDGIDSAKTEEG
jgi:hypothetical protein